MENYRLIPFDLSRAKTPENPSGLEVVTKHNIPVTIVLTNYRSEHSLFTILAVVHGIGEDETELYDKNGCGIDFGVADLRLKEPVTQRRMTSRELAWWLRDHPEEHREVLVRCDDLNRSLITGCFRYSASTENLEVTNVYVRSNAGEWHEPLIEE